MGLKPGSLLDDVYSLRLRKSSKRPRKRTLIVTSYEIFAPELLLEQYRDVSKSRFRVWYQTIRLYLAPGRPEPPLVSVPINDRDSLERIERALSTMTPMNGSIRHDHDLPFQRLRCCEPVPARPVTAAA